MNFDILKHDFTETQQEISKLCKEAIDSIDRKLEEHENIDDAKRAIQEMCKNGLLDQMEIALRKQGEQLHELADETVKLNKMILEWNPKI